MTGKPEVILSQKPPWDILACEVLVCRVTGQVVLVDFTFSVTAFTRYLQTSNKETVLLDRG